MPKVQAYGKTIYQKGSGTTFPAEPFPGITNLCCLCDVPEVREQYSAVPSGKNLGTAWTCVIQGNHGQLDYPLC